MLDEPDDATRSLLRRNEANWDARTPIHVASDFYGVDGARHAFDWFAPFEWDDLGPLAGRDVLHLQCHLGVETHAFALRDARTVVGLDFSGESVAHARRIAAKSEVDVEFVRADVYDAPRELGDRTFDLVYTGKGSLLYLPDLDRWARIVHQLLRPGGQLYLVEFHPLFNALGDVPTSGREELVLHKDYLDSGKVFTREVTRTYTDGPPVRGATTSYEWAHGIGEVTTALIDAGLTVEVLREHDSLPWPRWEAMSVGEDGWYRLPDNAPRIPLLFAVRARRPVETGGPPA